MARTIIEQVHIVAPVDTDSYNIVHHPQYLVWTEEAVLAWLMEEFGDLSACRYTVKSFQCKFSAPGLLYDQLLLRLICRNMQELPSGCISSKMSVFILNSVTNAVLMEGSLILEVQKTPPCVQNNIS